MSATRIILESSRFALPAGSITHEAQLLTCLRMSGLPVGLSMNVHALRVKDGLKRFVAS